MSIPVKYLPVYLGLFAVEMLALTCNIFLDIKYGNFTTEIVLWFFAVVFSITIGWRQAGTTTQYGNTMKNRMLILGMLITVFIFIPTWGLARAGIYFLAVLQLAYNCTTTTLEQTTDRRSKLCYCSSMSGHFGSRYVFIFNHTTN